MEDYKMLRTKLPVAFIATAILASCSAPARYGMVKDPETGLQFGSVVQKNIVTDSSFYKNRKIKVRIRNTSGDTAFNLRNFKNQIEQSYAHAGYKPTSNDDFGLLVDVNVVYSGQIQRNMSREFGFLGAVAGGLSGATTNRNIPTIAGTAVGATLGAIIGSHVTDDTYIIVTRVTFGVIKGPAQRDGKRITFSSSTFSTDEEGRKERSQRGFRTTHRTGVSVFAGGRNTAQSEIAQQVRERIARIIRDII
jgi:outer membrane lipoprotein SlyB